MIKNKNIMWGHNLLQPNGRHFKQAFNFESFEENFIFKMHNALSFYKEKMNAIIKNRLTFYPFKRTCIFLTYLYVNHFK